jgi:hypothetical protein
LYQTTEENNRLSFKIEIYVHEWNRPIEVRSYFLS